jgi:hypothetical protein
MPINGKVEEMIITHVCSSLEALLIHFDSPQTQSPGKRITRLIIAAIGTEGDKMSW